MAATSKSSLKFNASLLECVVCLEVPSSNPIFQCRNGHHYCKECHPKLLCFMISSKLHECPLCQQERGQLGNVKCLIAQKILENSKETDSAVKKTSEPPRGIRQNPGRPQPNQAKFHTPNRRPDTGTAPTSRMYCGICGRRGHERQQCHRRQQ